MIYGYFYINVYKNPNIQWINVNHMIDITKDYFYKTHNVDRIIYDYKSKPSNQDYQNFLEIILGMLTATDTLVVRSIFQLGNTKAKIYEALSIMRTKQVKLMINKWEVDISNTLKKVKELSVADLAIYENTQLMINDCCDYYIENNIYRKLAGYSLNEEYISKHSKNKFQNSSCNQHQEMQVVKEVLLEKDKEEISNKYEEFEKEILIKFSLGGISNGRNKRNNNGY